MPQKGGFSIIVYLLFQHDFYDIVKKITDKENCMKLLITGAGGFLGRRAASHFMSLGYDVLMPTHRQLDITDSAYVHDWIAKNRPDAVLHCAAVSDTGKCQKDPEGTAIINVDGSVNLASACAQNGTKFIFCSSDQVYSGSSLPGPHRESEILTPNNIYAAQKLLAEQRCAAVCPDTVSLRLSWMYATRFLPGEHGHLLINLRNALSDASVPLTWPVYDHRGITDADQVVRQLPATLDLPAGVYNFGSENDRDTFNTMQSVFNAVGLEDARKRLTPNLQAFYEQPRDIRMDISLAASHGIRFESTCESLRRALKMII